MPERQQLQHNTEDLREESVVEPKSSAAGVPRHTTRSGGQASEPLGPRPGLSIDAFGAEGSPRVQRNTLPEPERQGSGSSSGLQVGAAGDSYEREADAMADKVMNQIAPGSSQLAPPPMGRVARQGTAEVGSEGGAISNDLTSSIKASSGSAMPDGVRTRMEGGFGTDFSGVRVHADSPAASKIQARAFTHGNDIHFAPGQFQPDSPGGQHLIAHELTHVVQQSGGVQRLMWQPTEFDEKTSESWTTKSSAQKEIRKLLAQYHAQFPFGDLDETKAKSAFDAVTAMKVIADAYLAKNVKEVDGQSIERGSRSNRIAGMRAFSGSCAGELSWLKGRIDRGKDAANLFDAEQATTQVRESAGVKKLTDHYEGDATSCFRKLGSLIEAAVPAAGDSASIALEVKIPVSPGVTVNLGFGAEAARGDREDKYKMPSDPTQLTPAPKVSPVEVGLNVYVGAGGNVGPAAEVAGALGVYLKSRAQTGADAAELISYALFRRGRSSNLVPREVVNFMWGEGNSDEFGWLVAEQWSLGVEKRLLDTAGVDAEGEEKNENMVETGGFGKASAEIGISGVAKAEIEAEAYTGTRIDAASLKARKGGAGKTNKKSGKFGGDMTRQQGRGQGTQKDVGRTTRGFKLSGAVGNDMLKGSLEFAMQWISDGAHGKKTYSISDATIGGSFAFTMPGDQIVGGGIGNMVPTVIESVNRMIAHSKAKAAKEEGTDPRALGNIAQSLDSAATASALLAKATEKFTPPTQLAEEVSGFSSSTTYTLGLEYDIKGKEFKITLSQDKTSEATKVVEHMSKTASGAAGVKLEMSKSSRLLEVTFDGTAWSAKWAGS